MKQFFNRVRKGTTEMITKSLVKIQAITTDEQGNAIWWILGIILALIVFAYVFIPGVRAFFNKMIADMNTYYDGLPLFPNS